MNSREIIVGVMQEVRGVAKKQRNIQGSGYNFRGIDAVVNAIGPALRKHGGFIVPTVETVMNTTATTAKGSVMNVVHVQVSYAVYGTEGEAVVGSAAGEAFDSGDKATAKAMSVAYRTFLLQTFCLPTDDPDPDSFTHEASPALNGVEFKGIPAPSNLFPKNAKTMEELNTLWALAVEQGQSAKLQPEFAARKIELGG